MHKCCDCGKEAFLYSVVCSRAANPGMPGSKETTASRGLCFECVNNELKQQGLPAIKKEAI